MHAQRQRPGRPAVLVARSITAMTGGELPAELADLRAMIRRLAEERIAPRAAEIDRSAAFPQDIRELLAENDIFALPFAERYGGTGTGTLMLQMAVEEIARADASCALILMLQELGTLPIALFGSEELRASGCCRAAPRGVAAGVRALGGRGRLGPGGDAHRSRGATAATGSSTAPRAGSRTPASPTSTSCSRSPTARSGASRRSWSRPTGPASRSPASSTSSGSAARRPARRCSRTCGCRRRT